MQTQPSDIWFGPGGTRGVFGAGVAFGLQQRIENSELDAASLRLYGSSVGCLTAAYLATGNTACGLDIFREDAPSVVAAENVLPLLAASALNRFGRLLGRRSSLLRVPQVLKVDTVLAHMLRRTPDIVAQLREAAMPVFAEYVDRRSGEYCHADLRAVDDPLRYIRGALNLVPLVSNGHTDLLDSNVKGYGFSQLLVRNEDRRLVAVLNHQARSSLRRWIASRMCAVVAGDARIAELYVRRDASCARTLASAQATDRALLVAPDSSSRPPSVDQSFIDGVAASQRIVSFLRSGTPSARRE